MTGSLTDPDPGLFLEQSGVCISVRQHARIPSTHPVWAWEVKWIEKQPSLPPLTIKKGGGGKETRFYRNKPWLPPKQFEERSKMIYMYKYKIMIDSYAPVRFIVTAVDSSSTHILT